MAKKRKMKKNLLKEKGKIKKGSKTEKRNMVTSSKTIIIGLRRIINIRGMGMGMGMGATITGIRGITVAKSFTARKDSIDA